MKRCPRAWRERFVSASLVVLGERRHRRRRKRRRQRRTRYRRARKPRQVQPPLSSPDSRAARAPADDSQPRSVAQPTAPRDLSPWSMFLAADIVVKAVMVELGVRLARDLDDFLRQDGAAFPRATAASRRAHPHRRCARAVGGAHGLERGRHRTVGAGARRACTRCACRATAPAMPASRSAAPRVSPKSRARRRAPCGTGWRCSPRSARPRPSSGCSAPSGAS